MTAWTKIIRGATAIMAAAGVGTLGMVEFDRVDESNLQRQVLYLGEINDSQRAAWTRAIEVFADDGAAKPPGALLVQADLGRYGSACCKGQQRQITL